MEPSGLSRTDGKRPDGMTLFPFRSGKCLVWDATCADSFASTNITHTSVEAGAAAAIAENRKRTKYRTLAEQYAFEPMSFETTGVYGPATRNTVREIGRAITQQTGDLRETAWLKQRLAIAIVRGNAICLTRDPGRTENGG